MRLVTFRTAAGAERVGALLPDDRVVDLFAGSAASGRGAARLPVDMVAFFAGGPETRRLADEVVAWAADRADATGPEGEPVVHDPAAVKLLAPVPRPPRIRDYLTFESHAAGSGLAVPEAFAEMPICYKGNPYSVIGPEDEIVWPAYTDQLDYELELGFYIGRGGRNVTVDDAADHIAGATIFNDVSARDIQIREMSLQIGPSKGKDFCNVMGPCVVTMDELDEFGLRMVARINGEVWSEGTSAERRFSFAEVVAWASYCETIHPGEFIGVGTVGGGCGYEIGRWIQPGDVVELEIEGIGVLRNRVGEREEVPPGAGLPTYRIPARASAH